MESPPQESHFRWWLWPLMPFAFVAGMVVIVPLAMLGLLSIPYSLVMGLLLWRAERRFRRRMREAGRFIEWGDLEPRLAAGEGTLVIEQANKLGVRVWWTPEDVAARSPVLVTPFEEMDFIVLRDPSPFVCWCDDRYLDAQSGSALLTACALSLPPGLGFATFFREKYPRLNAIDTVYRRPPTAW